MKWPSTPVSFMRRSTVSASFDVQDFHEQPVGSGSSRSCVLTSFSEPRHRAHGVGVERQIVLLREPEDPDQVDRVVLEDVGRGEVDAVMSTMKSSLSGTRRVLGRSRDIMRLSTVLVWPAGPPAWRTGSRLRSPTSLGDQEIVLHEAFDILHAGCEV